MRVVTLRQLRHDFASVFDSIEAGESVEISKRGKVIALLTPPTIKKSNPPKKRPDFVGRLKRIYGDKVFEDNIVIDERESRPY